MPSFKHLTSSGRLTLTIGSTGEPIATRELSQYLHYLRAAYVRTLRAIPEQLDLSPESVEEDAYHAVRLAVLENTPVSGYTLSASGSSKLPPASDLYFLELERRNPLEIVLIGIPAILVAAVVFSGGRVKFGPEGVEAEVNSLGDGIKSIKDAFSRKTLPPVSPRQLPSKGKVKRSPRKRK
jgi:hypothetical protein